MSSLLSRLPGTEEEKQPLQPLSQPEAPAPDAEDADAPRERAMTSVPTGFKGDGRGSVIRGSLSRESTAEELAEESREHKLRTGPTYGLGLRKPDRWCDHVEWSGAHTDRSFGVRGRPTSGSPSPNWADRVGKIDAHDRESKAQRATKAETEREERKIKGLVLDMPVRMAAVAPAPPSERPDFSGTWKCVEVDGDWDRYLELLGTDGMTRSLAFGANYGRGHAMQKLTLGGESGTRFTVVNINYVSASTGWDDSPEFRVLMPQVMPPVEYELSTEDRSATDGLTADDVQPTDALPTPPPPDAGEQALRMGWEGTCIVSRHAVGEKGTPCVIKRELSADGHRMVMTVLIENFFASRTFKPCYEHGQLIDFYDED